MIDKHKAHLIAKGFTQVPCINFDQTFCPIINLKQLNIKADFLHVDLKETIYMEQPTGFTNTTFPFHVCSLIRSL